MWRDPVPDQKAEAEQAEADDPRDRDVLRRDRGRARDRGTGEIRANVVASQADLHARYGGVVPEIASRRHLELVVPGGARGARRGGRDARRRRRVAVTQGPGLIGALLVGALRGEGARLGARPAARRRSTTCTGTSPRSTSSPTRRAAVPLPARERRAHAAARRPRPRRLRRARHDDRRRGRRGVRQGRAAARPRLSRRARDRPARARGRSRGVRVSRSRACPGSTSRSPALKTALLYAVRDLGRRGRGAAADLAASYQRAIVRALVERTRAAAERDGPSGSPSSAASPRTPSCARRCPAPRFAPLAALHRQRGDDRLGGAVRQAAFPIPLP